MVPPWCVAALLPWFPSISIVLCWLLQRHFPDEFLGLFEIWRWRRPYRVREQQRRNDVLPTSGDAKPHCCCQ
jgi:hypothetical protein